MKKYTRLRSFLSRLSPEVMFGSIAGIVFVFILMQFKKGPVLIFYIASMWFIVAIMALHLITRIQYLLTPEYRHYLKSQRNALEANLLFHQSWIKHYGEQLTEAIENNDKHFEWDHSSAAASIDRSNIIQKIHEHLIWANKSLGNAADARRNLEIVREQEIRKRVSIDELVEADLKREKDLGYYYQKISELEKKAELIAKEIATVDALLEKVKF